MASLGLTLPVNAAIFGNFGGTLEQARKTEFFTWFHLQQAEAQSEDGGQVVSFKPSGPNFQKLVTVKMVTTAGGRLKAMELVLLRSFVDSPADGIFARDIAKSFLLAGLAAPRDRETIDLIHEIQYRGASTMPVLRHKSVKEPRLPEKPTPGYLAYLGQQPSYEHQVSGLLVRLKNTTQAGVSVLVVSIGSQRGKAG